VLGKPSEWCAADGHPGGPALAPRVGATPREAACHAARLHDGTARSRVSARAARTQVLTYGIATAAVLRFVMIAAGSTLIERFQPTLLAFAAVLLFSAYKIVARSGDEAEEDLSSNSIVRLCRRGLGLDLVPIPNPRHWRRSGERRAAQPGAPARRARAQAASARGCRQLRGCGSAARLTSSRPRRSGPGGHSRA